MCRVIGPPVFSFLAASKRKLPGRGQSFPRIMRVSPTARVSATRCRADGQNYLPAADRGSPSRFHQACRQIFAHWLVGGYAGDIGQLLRVAAKVVQLFRRALAKAS